MEKSKKKKILRYVLVGIYVVMCITLSMAVSLLPNRYGVEWIIGWPEFLSDLISYAPVIILFAFSLLRTLKQPLNKKFTKTQKMISVWSSAVLCALYIGMCVFSNFFGQSRKIERYITSPNGENKAVVFVDNDEDSPEMEYIYPVRAGLFYEYESRVFLYLKREDATFTWLDDNTLEITRIWTGAAEDGETPEAKTDVFRW